MTPPKQARHSGYYEAIIQLRPATEAIIRFINNQCKKRGEAISKIAEQKNGLDLYITSQRLARTLGPKMKRAFGGELLITRKLHSKDRLSSVTLYRATVLFKPRIKQESKEQPL